MSIIRIRHPFGVLAPPPPPPPPPLPLLLVRRDAFSRHHREHAHPNV
jgi:hypothetical protein